MFKRDPLPFVYVQLLNLSSFHTLSYLLLLFSRFLLFRVFKKYIYIFLSSALPLLGFEFSYHRAESCFSSVFLFFVPNIWLSRVWVSVSVFLLLAAWRRARISCFFHSSKGRELFFRVSFTLHKKLVCVSLSEGAFFCSC